MLLTPDYFPGSVTSGVLLLGEALLWPGTTLLINHSLLGVSKTVGRLIHRPRRADILRFLFLFLFWRLSSTTLIFPPSPRWFSLLLPWLPFSTPLGGLVAADAIFFSKLVAIGGNKFHS